MQVMEMKIGNTIIRGYDDRAVKTDTECQEILDNIGRIAAGIYRDQEQKKEEFVISLKYQRIRPSGNGGNHCSPADQEFDNGRD